MFQVSPVTLAMGSQGANEELCSRLEQVTQQGPSEVGSVPLHPLLL